MALVFNQLLLQHWTSKLTRYETLNSIELSVMKANVYCLLDGKNMFNWNQQYLRTFQLIITIMFNISITIMFLVIAIVLLIITRFSFFYNKFYSFYNNFVLL